MSLITDEQIIEYVADNIGSFHQNRLQKLNELKLNNLLSRKNPYLFKSKNIVTVADLIKSLLDAHLSSQEETLFGDFLEGLAVHIAETVLNGQKSGIEGIDLEFTKNDVRYIVSIKSGPNWGNSSQQSDMKNCFRRAIQTIRQGNAGVAVQAVNGCCYGRESKSDKGTHLKICGQEFWELISNDQDLYTRIIEPLGHDAKKRNDNFMENYGTVVNRFSRDFTNDFCSETGAIDWPKLVAFISGATPLTSLPISKRYVNRLHSSTSIRNALRYWGESDLADRITYLMSSASEMDGNQPVSLESVRGFLLFWGAVKSDGMVTLTSSAEGSICSEWTFPDHRAAKMFFLNIDRVSMTATGADGTPVRIRNSDTSVTRETVRKRLIQQGLFGHL